MRFRRACFILKQNFSSILQKFRQSGCDEFITASQVMAEPGSGKWGHQTDSKTGVSSRQKASIEGIAGKKPDPLWDLWALSHRLLPT
jgi:hypothetical protein